MHRHPGYEACWQSREDEDFAIESPISLPKIPEKQLKFNSLSM